MIFKSCHGTDDSDIFTGDGYTLVRQTLGFGIERVAIIYGEVKVHQIERQEALAKAMDWCREHSLTLPIPEVDLPRLMESGR